MVYPYQFKKLPKELFSMSELEKAINDMFDLVDFYVTPQKSTTTNSVTNCLNSGTSGLMNTYANELFPFPNTQVYYPTNYFTYGYNQSKPTFPPMDIIQSKEDKFIEIKMAIAGFSKENIKIKVDKDLLIVKGEIKPAEFTDEVVYIKQNLKAEKFNRAFKFPDNHFDYKNPKVTFKDGLLTIRIEKNPELVKEEKDIVIE
jgi:HSP20 family protein